MSEEKFSSLLSVVKNKIKISNNNSKSQTQIKLNIPEKDLKQLAEEIKSKNLYHYFIYYQ